MTKKDIIEIMSPWNDAEEVSIIIAEGSEHLDELEVGSLLTVVDGTWSTRTGAALIVEPK